MGANVIKITDCVNRVKMSEEKKNHLNVKFKNSKKEESTFLKFLTKLEAEPNHRGCQIITVPRLPKCLEQALPKLFHHALTRM